jgi:hypothetical protein
MARVVLLNLGRSLVVALAAALHQLRRPRELVTA